MSCTFSMLDIKVSGEEQVEIISRLFCEVLSDELYSPYYEPEDVFGAEEGDLEGEYLLHIEDEPLFARGHCIEGINQLVLEFLKTVPDADGFEADYFSSYDSPCDAARMHYEYGGGVLRVIELYSEYSGFVCGECDAEVEYEDVDLEFGEGICCTDCGAEYEDEDGERYSLNTYEIKLVDGAWIIPEGFGITPLDEFLTGVAPDEVAEAWKYEQQLDDEGVLPEASHGTDAWGELPRVRSLAEEDDERAVAILAALRALGEPESEDSEDEE